MSTAKAVEPILFASSKLNIAITLHKAQMKNLPSLKEAHHTKLYIE
jgi:hypothetical protein